MHNKFMLYKRLDLLRSFQSQLNQYCVVAKLFQLVSTPIQNVLHSFNGTSLMCKCIQIPIQFF